MIASIRPPPKPAGSADAGISTATVAAIALAVSVVLIACVQAVTMLAIVPEPTISVISGNATVTGGLLATLMRIER